jgi:hypothetical protein
MQETLKLIPTIMYGKKEYVRSQQKLEKMQNQRGYIRIERAFMVTTLHPGNVMVSISTCSSTIPFNTENPVNWELEAKRLFKMI